MSDITLLVDGMYVIFSSFYANRNMRTLKGEPTGAVYGFVTRMENLIRDFNPAKILVAFDSKEKTFRHRIYPEYKAKRQVPPEELVQQIPLIKEFLGLRGIESAAAPGFEADDIIAVLSRSSQMKNHEVLICSADKDLFQLVKGNVFIYHPRLKKKMDAAAIKESFGVFPHQIVDYLSLVGDASDNIPGVPGVGEKTALKLIETHGSLEHILDNINNLEGKLRDKMQSGLDLLRTSRKLVDLTEIPDLSTEISVSRFNARSGAELNSFYRKLSFNSLIKEPEGDGDTPETDPEITYTIIRTPAQLKALKSDILKAGYFAFDVETTGIEFFSSDLVGLSISFEDCGFYLPFKYPSDSNPKIDFDFLGFKKELQDVFENPNIRKTGHNLKFDVQHLKQHGVDVRGIYDDSMLMSYLLYPNRRAHNLKDLTLELLGVRQLEYADLTGRGKMQTGLDAVPLSKISKYCIDDSFLSLRLCKVLDKKIIDNGLEELYRNIEIPLIRILLEMEFTGVEIDRHFIKNASRKLEKRIEETEKEIYDMAGYRLNLNSSQQLGELLFERMNLPGAKKTRKTKSYSTDIEVLTELKGIPIVEKIIRYRTYKKMLSTYLTGLNKRCDHHQRIHTSFNQTVTATGRLSSSNPNLQNIPVGELAGINIRNAFVAGSRDRYLLSADYSQIELRVMAHYSEDNELMDAFSRDQDIHQHTADSVFGDDSSLSAGEKRRRAKIINFSVLYGSGPYSLSRELEVSYKEARDFIDRYYLRYSGVKTFIDRVISNAEQKPEVKTLAGRRRPIPEIQSSNRSVKENGRRMAINTIIQGTAADIIKIAMINMFQSLQEMDCHLILQVHDELVFEYAEGEERKLRDLVKDKMENAVKLKVPLKVSFKKGKNWGDMSPL
jgi:DNA polymerase-1